MLKKVRNSKAKALRYVDERVAEVSSCRSVELPNCRTAENGTIRKMSSKKGFNLFKRRKNRQADYDEVGSLGKLEM